VTSKEAEFGTGQVEERTPSWRELLLFFVVRGFLSVGDSKTQIRKMHHRLTGKLRWFSDKQLLGISSFCECIPGPAALHLAILVGYLKRNLPGGVLAGLLFLLPGVIAMILLTKLYVAYDKTPQLNALMVVLKPAVLGIVTAGLVKLAAETIRNYFLALVLLASLAATSLWETNLLLVLIAGGSINLLVSLGLPRLQRKATRLQLLVVSGLVPLLILVHPHWLRVGWLFLKSGLFSFGGSYTLLAILHRGAVEEYRWVSVGQLLDGLALSVALPGSIVLFATFVGYLAGGATGAILGTFFVFMPSFVLVMAGARYLKEVHRNEAFKVFLSGVSAAVVGALIFIVIEVAPVAFGGTATVGISICTFLAVTLLNIDVGLVGAVSIAGGILYAMDGTGAVR
jgi:chromate transporter